MNHSRFDIDKNSTGDVFPLLYHGLATVLEDERSQICGIDCILNYNDVTFKYVSSFTVKQHVDFVQFLLNSTPGRFKGIYLVNMPAFANNLLSFAKLAMSEKMKSRLHLVKNFEELSKFIDAKVLPKEFGGEVPEAEIIEKFIECFEKNEDKLKVTNCFEIDLEKLAVDGDEMESVGSFRKLEID
jgi:CRAL/TRIO domain